MAGKDFIILDIFGREILKRKLKSENTILDITEIEPGFYILCINVNIFKRLIIN
jgi:hypothetical protein